LRRRSIIAPLVIALAISSWTSGMAADAPPAAPPAAATAPSIKPIYTREIEFGIPFHTDPPDPAARRAVEVQLHVAENGGNWKLYGTAAPEQRRIPFRAHGDGQYELMLRTRDDTDPPVLELVAERGAPGEIRAHWRSSDPHLLPKTLRVEYQLGSAGAWLPVAVDNPKTTSTSASGQATWIVDAQAKQINIQAQVLDEAGNVAKTLQRVDLTNATAEHGADWRQLGAPKTDAHSDTVVNWPGERTNESPLGPGPPPMGSMFPGVDGPRPGAYDRTQYAGSTRRARGPQPEVVLPRELIAQQEILPPPAPDTQLAQPGRSRPPLPGHAEEIDLPRSPIERRQPAPRTGRELPGGDDGPRLSQASDGGETVLPGETIPPGPPGGPSPRPTAAKPNDQPEAEPAADRPRMVKSDRFELEYDVEEVGRAGVGKVEVWGTKNNGRTWSSYGIDPDNQSPVTVKVDGEGRYGFRIVIESGAGLRGDVPRPGDTPDVWVGVDLTKPVVRITGTEVGIGLQTGDMIIRWEAFDNLLPERPISLFYSSKPGGPWVKIATGLPNSGRFVWRLDKDAPERVFLRIEVRDEAGNVEQYDTADAVALDPVRPKGRIRSVRPAEESPAASGLRPYRILR
jgi:hypothetical protein